MTTSGQRPFTASTNKFAYAQAFSGASRQHRSQQPSHTLLTRGLSALRHRSRPAAGR